MWWHKNGHGRRVLAGLGLFWTWHFYNMLQSTLKHVFMDLPWKHQHLLWCNYCIDLDRGVQRKWRRAERIKLEWKTHREFCVGACICGKTGQETVLQFNLSSISFITGVSPLSWHMLYKWVSVLNLLLFHPYKFSDIVVICNWNDL